MQIKVTKTLEEALGKYRTARKAYVEVGHGSYNEKTRQISMDYQTALEVLGYQVLLEAELQGIIV